MPKRNPSTPAQDAPAPPGGEQEQPDAEAEAELSAQEEELRELQGWRSQILLTFPQVDTWLWLKLCVLIANLPAVTKDGRFVDKSGKERYRFISQAQVMSLVGKRMAAIGLLRLSEVVEHHVHREDDNDSVHVTLKVREHLVCADSGRRESFECYGEAADWGDKATQKAWTSADKYFLMKLFDLSDFRDPDAEDPGDERDEHPRRSTSSAAARSTSQLQEQRQQQMLKLQDFASGVGIQADGSRKPNAPQWLTSPGAFGAKLKARFKYHSGNASVFEAMDDQEWRKGLTATYLELVEEHRQWCGPDCEHVRRIKQTDPQEVEIPQPETPGVDPAQAEEAKS